MEPGGGADALTVDQRPPDRFLTVLGHGLATGLLGRSPQARQDALSDHGPFIGTEHRQHLEHHGAGGRARIQPLAMDVEVHALGLDVAEEVDQIGKASADPADREGRNQIEVLASHALEQIVEAGPLDATLGPADAFVEEGGDDLPVLPFSNSEQIAKLVLDRLGAVGRRDTAVEGYALGQGCSPIR